MNAARPPRFCACAITVRVSVVLPEDSGPKTSTTRPRGNPPTPSARSIKMFPVGITSDRKSTRLNSSHVAISYAVFCLKKKNMDSLEYSERQRRTQNPTCPAENRRFVENPPEQGAALIADC